MPRPLLQLLLFSSCWHALLTSGLELRESSRRHFVSGMLLIVGASGGDAHAQIPPSAEEDRTVYRLKSGVQFRNLRQGQGPLVTDLDDPTLLLHVKALLMNGSVLMDTRQSGKPNAYKLGSSVMSTSPELIAPGLDDALVSRGVLVDGETRVPPMRQGGVRLVVVPAPLAYGAAGVSRYQIMTKLDGRFTQPVPRNKMLRYELEVLRCISVDDVGQACCPEEVYPCQVPQSVDQ